MGWKDTITAPDAAPVADTTATVPADKPAGKSWRDTIAAPDSAPVAAAPQPADDDSGVWGSIKGAAKDLVSGISLPTSLDDAGKRLADSGLLRAPDAPATDDDGKIKDIRTAAVAHSGNSAPQYPLLPGGGLLNVAARVTGSSALAGVDAGTRTPGKFDTDAATKAALLGGSLALIGEGVGGAVGEGEGLKEFANNRSAASMGWTKGMRNKFGNDAAQEAGRVGLDEGVVSPLASTEDKLERMGALQAKSGKTIGDVMSTLDDTGVKKFVPGDVAMQVESELGNTYAGEPLHKSQANQYENLIDTILKRGDKPISYADAQQLKKVIGDYGYKSGIAVPGREQAQQAYGIINKQLDDAVAQGADSLGSPELLDTLQKARKNYGSSSQSLEALTGKQAGEQGNRMFGLTDAVTAAPMLANPIGAAHAAATLGVKSVAERYGNNLMAIGADKLADILATSPNLLGRYAPVLAAASQRGPGALQAAHAALLKQDPGYAKQLLGGAK